METRKDLLLRLISKEHKVRLKHMSKFKRHILQHCTIYSKWSNNNSFVKRFEKTFFNTTMKNE